MMLSAPGLLQQTGCYNIVRQLGHAIGHAISKLNIGPACGLRRRLIRFFAAFAAQPRAQAAGVKMLAFGALKTPYLHNTE